MARLLGGLLVLRRKFRHLQQNVWVTWRRDRLHDVDVALSGRHSGRSEAKRRNRAPDGARHDRRNTRADWRTACKNGRYGRTGPIIALRVPTGGGIEDKLAA